MGVGREGEGDVWVGRVGLELGWKERWCRGMEGLVWRERYGLEWLVGMVERVCWRVERVCWRWWMFFWMVVESCVYGPALCTTPGLGL